MKDYLKYLQVQTNKAPARILLNTEATKEMLDAEGYDALIIAVGSEQIIPNLPGIDKPHVHWAPDADTGKIKVGNKTVIVGGGAVGIECAIGLKKEGKDVTIVEMASDTSYLMASSGGVAMEFMSIIDELKIPLHLSCKLEEVTDKTVICRNLQTQEKIEFPADTVLYALGMSPRHAVADALRRSAPETEVYVVGDAIKPAAIGQAVMSAFRAAAYI
jgi:pyruvate/2-oxoglutarate dehydrogenase complex dihydrolipoamide dehydrogenase (E3) component